jgi:hypothetical protein
VKRSELERKIRRAARVAGIETRVRSGGRHDLWVCGSVRVTIARHREINEFTAEGIQKDLEDEFGKGWWR